MADHVKRNRLFLPLALLLPRVACVSDSVLEPFCASHAARCEPQCLWESLLFRLLDAELGRYERAGIPIRERGHDPRTAVERAVADLLGHHERGHRVLLVGSGTWVFCMGICVAAS